MKRKVCKVKAEVQKARVFKGTKLLSEANSHLHAKLSLFIQKILCRTTDLTAGRNFQM